MISSQPSTTGNKTTGNKDDKESSSNKPKLKSNNNTRKLFKIQTYENTSLSSKNIKEMM